MRKHPVDMPDHLTRLDYYQIITSVLMTILGGVILIRSFFTGFYILTLLIGGGFLFIGIYRLRFVYKYLTGKK